MANSAPTFTDEAARQNHGWSAVTRHLYEALVFIVEGPPNEDKYERANGSGTLIRTPAGNVVVLTAKHVLEDDVPPDGFSIGGSMIESGLANPFVRHWAHPTVDVAVALLTPEAIRVVERYTAPHDSVAADDEIGEQEPTVLCGFPIGYRVQKVDEAKKIKWQLYTSVTYNTTVRGLDDGERYRVIWDEGVSEDPQGFFKVFGVEPGKVFQQTHPGGISGGSLWKVSRVQKDALWVASRAAKIIGVASSFCREDKIEFCPSVQSWRDWYRETIVEIDAGTSVGGKR